MFNPILTSEERHRAIHEKREQRKKDQRLKELEVSKDRRVAGTIKARPAKSINRDIETVMMHSGTTPTKSYGNAGQIDIEKIREAKLKIEQEAQESQEEVRQIKEDLRRYKKELQEQDKAKRDFEVQ